MYDKNRNKLVLLWTWSKRPRYSARTWTVPPFKSWWTHLFAVKVPPFEFRRLAVVICARWSRGTMCLIECPADPSETRGTFHHLFWAGEILRPQQPLVPSPFSLAGLLHTFWAHAFTEEPVACTREGRPSPEVEEKQWILAGAVTAATCWRDQEQRSVKESGLWIR